MSDLERVVGLAEEKRLEAERVQTALHDNYQKNQETATRSFNTLASRVSVFAHDLKGKASIYVTKNPTTNIIIVSISSYSPAIQLPYCRITINTTSEAEKYSCRIKIHDKDEDFQGCIELEKVVELLSENAAEFISKRGSLTYELPYWYITVGEIISWPLFLLTWALCISMGGIGGALIGWLPGLIVKFVAKFLWLPLLIFVFIKMG